MIGLGDNNSSSNHTAVVPEMQPTAPFLTIDSRSVASDPAKIYRGDKERRTNMSSPNRHSFQTDRKEQEHDQHR